MGIGPTFYFVARGPLPVYLQCTAVCMPPGTPLHGYQGRLTPEETPRAGHLACMLSDDHVVERPALHMSCVCTNPQALQLLHMQNMRNST